MTIEEKRDFLNNYCDGCSCVGCKLVGEWEHPFHLNLNAACLYIDEASEEELDKAISLIKGKPTNTEDIINHPKHYNREGAMESIDEMVLIFGKEAVKHFCLCNAWKYRYRADDKNGIEDMKKSDWYIAKYKELSEYGRAKEYPSHL